MYLPAISEATFPSAVVVVVAAVSDEGTIGGDASKDSSKLCRKERKQQVSY